MTIRALFVDAGGVLYNNINEETEFLVQVADRYGLDREELERSVYDVAPLYEGGVKHVHQVFQRLVNPGRWTRKGKRLDTRWLDGAYLASVRAYRENFRALQEVRRDDPRLTVVLTNNEAEHWDRLKDEAFRHFRMFDTLCSSWHIRQVKPSRAYFAEAMRRIGVPAAETLLIDDRAAVLRVGAALGMRTLHVDAPEVFAGRIHAAVRGEAVPSAL
ncbi:HAD family hydrolase [Streptomyces sp. NPDC017056]|uniref:HAD family hydrolase n=1 Tax=Streptomyces sp. NPDC017056 TaxID=3364973 RepID=UPI0037AFC8E2